MGRNMIRLAFTAMVISAGFTVFTAKTAHAEFCDDYIATNYFEDPDDHMVSTAFRDCTREWRGTLRRSGVAAEIMVETALSPPPNLISEVRNGLDMADGALIKLGSEAQIGDRVKVILATVEYTDADAYATLSDGICYLVILPSSHELLERPGAMAFIMAHELFHCVQKATFPNIAPGDNKWWGEGSAHWFAHMAQPDQVVETYSRSANRFERESGRNTLRHFHYSLWPFFAWYAQHRGNAQDVMQFLKNLPEGHHSDTTLAGLLDPTDWYEFAKDYSAYQIRVSPRVAVNPRPRANLSETRIALNDVGDQRDYFFNRRTGALERYKIVLGPGDWQMSSNASEPMFLSEIGASGDPGTDWQKIIGGAGSLSLSVECEDEKTYALVGFGSRADMADFTLTARKVGDPCELSCRNPPPSQDICLHGIWRETTLIIPTYIKREFAARLTEHRDDIIDLQFPPPIVTMSPGGKTATVDVTGSATFLVDGHQGKIELTSRGESIWGTSGGKLLVCPKSISTRGSLTVTVGGRSQSSPIKHDRMLGSEDELILDYTCDGSVVTLHNAERDITGRLER